MKFSMQFFMQSMKNLYEVLHAVLHAKHEELHGENLHYSPLKMENPLLAFGLFFFFIKKIKSIKYTR